MKLNWLKGWWSSYVVSTQGLLGFGQRRTRSVGSVGQHARWRRGKSVGCLLAHCHRVVFVGWELRLLDKLSNENFVREMMIDYHWYLLLLETNRETRGFSSGASTLDEFAFCAGYLLCCLTLDIKSHSFRRNKFYQCNKDIIVPYTELNHYLLNGHWILMFFPLT